MTQKIKVNNNLLPILQALEKHQTIDITNIPQKKRAIGYLGQKQDLYEIRTILVKKNNYKILSTNAHKTTIQTD